MPTMPQRVPNSEHVPKTAVATTKAAPSTQAPMARQRPELVQEHRLTHADYAAFARQPDERLLRDCQVETFHASGPGGQGVNTADSAVRMRHEPTGIVVTARSERSQLLNRQACLAKIRAELTRRAQPPKHRKKTHVPHRSKERRLQAKHASSEKKRLRGRVRPDE